MHHEQQPSSSKPIHEGIPRIQSSKRDSRTTASSNAKRNSSNELNGPNLSVNYDICNMSRTLPKQYICPRKALGTTEFIMQSFSMLDQTMPVSMNKRPSSSSRKSNGSRKLSSATKRPPSVADNRPKPFDLSSHINVSGSNKISQFLKFEGPMKKIEQMMGRSVEENVAPPPEPVNHHVAKIKQSKMQSTVGPSPLLNSFYMSKPKNTPSSNHKNPLDSLNSTHYFNPYRQSSRKGEDHHLFAETPLMFQPEAKKGRYTPDQRTKISYVGIMNTTESQLHYDKSELSFKIDTVATLDSDRNHDFNDDYAIPSKTSLDPRAEDVRLSNTMDRDRKRKRKERHHEFSYYRPTRQKPLSTSILDREDNYARSLTETSPCERDLFSRSSKRKSYLLGDSMQTQKIWLIEEQDTSKTIKTMGDVGNKTYTSQGPQLMIRALRSRKPSADPNNNPQNNSGYVKSLNDTDTRKQKKMNNLIDGLMGKRMEMSLERRDTSESKTRVDHSYEKRARSVKSRSVRRDLNNTVQNKQSIPVLSGNAKEILVKKEKRARFLEKQLIIQQGEDEIQGWD